MKKTQKIKILDAVLEIVLEVILMLIAGGAGVLIFRLFGAKDEFIDENYDLMMLLGLFAIFIAIGVILWILTRLFGNKEKNERGKKMKSIIIDTDIGSDCDDMMALAYLIYKGVKK